MTGSNVIAGQDTRLNAGGDILVEASESTTTNTSFDHKSKFGFSLEGLTLSLGTKKEETDVKTDQTDQVGSTIGSLNGDISITANDNITIAASDIITRGGDIDVDGDSVDIISRDQVLDSEMRHMVSFTGVSVGLSGGAADSINSYLASTEAAENTDNDTLKLLHQWKANNALKDIESELASLDHLAKDFENPLGEANKSVDADGNAESSGINVSISLGSSRSETRQNTQQRTAQGSTLSAGGDINITARGDGNSSNSGDITSQGSYISADNIVLDAENDINLISAENTNDSQSTQKSSNAAIGISFGSDGFNIYAEASKSKGFTNQSDDQYLETQLIANNNITLRSGNNTTLEGAEVRGDSITADIGGDLTITSQQDHSTYEQENKTMGFKAQYGTNSGVSASMSELEANANYLAVQEQSGLFAGDGGFDIEVGNHTALNGGVIVSTADPDNNRISTETLSTQQIENTTEYSVESTSISVGNIGGMSLSGGHAKDDDKQSNTTYSAISNGTIDVRSGDTTALANIKGSEAEAHSILENNFNPDKVKEVQEQAELVAMLAQEGSEFVGDYAQARLEEANDKRAEANKSNDPNEQVRLNAEADQLDSNWKEGGILRVASHALVGGISGGIEGALGSAATATIIPELADALSEAGVSEDLRKGLLIAASAGIGSTANGAAGALHSTGQTQFNYLKHEEAVRLAELQSKAYDKNYTPEEREGFREEIANLKALDTQRDNIAETACQIASSVACGNAITELAEFRQGYIDAGAVTQPRSMRRSVLQESNKVESLLNDYANNLRNETAYNNEQGIRQSIEEGIEGVKTLAETINKLRKLDPEAMAQVAVAYGEVEKFKEDPVGQSQQIAQAIQNEWQDIEQQLASDDPAVRAVGEQRRAKFSAEVITSLTGVAAAARTAGKVVIDLGADVTAGGKRLIDFDALSRQRTGLPEQDLSKDMVVNEERLPLKNSIDERAGFTDAEASNGYPLISENSDFSTQGLNPDSPDVQIIKQDLVKQYENSGLNTELAESLADGNLRSSSTIPTTRTVGQTEELYKFVPKDGAAGKSSYYFTKEQYDYFQQNPVKLAQEAGLPYKNFVSDYDVYTIKPKTDTTPQVFESQVADIQQGAYHAEGGATQTIVPNLQDWTTPVKKDSLSVYPSTTQPVSSNLTPAVEIKGEVKQNVGGLTLSSMSRREYQGASYHGSISNSVKSKAPANGQDALDVSVQVKDTSPRRVGVDHETGEFSVFDQTSEGIFHGHVRSWSELTTQMQNALIKTGIADRKGNVLGGSK